MSQEYSTALIVHEEYSYQQETQQTVGWVLSEYCQHEAASQVVEDYKSFAQRRLSVYVDALKRGRETILQQLDRGDLKYEVANGLGWKQFSRGLDSIFWTIYPKSGNPEDPFERVRFVRELGFAGIDNLHGHVELLTEPVLVGMMLERGLKEQDQQYDDFQKICQKVADVEQEARETLAYLVSPQEVFAPLDEVNRHMNSIRGEFLKKEFFIKRYLIPNHRILHGLPRIDDMVTQVNRLRRLFTGIKYQHSLVCNLIANKPQLFERMQSALRPETTRAEVENFNKLVQMMTQDPLERLRQKWLLAHWVSEQAEPKLIPYFQKVGIQGDLGLEYIFHLLLASLDQPITIDSVNLVVEGRSDQSQTELPPFAKDFFWRDNFPDRLYSKLSPAHKVAGLRAILRYNQTLDAEVAQQKLAVLMDFFSLQFNLQKGIFEVPAPLLKSRSSLLQPDIIKMLLGLFVEQLDAGDRNLFPFLVNMIIKAGLPAFLRTRGLPANQTQFDLEFSDVVTAKRTRQEKTLEWRIARLVEVTAGYFASLYAMPSQRNMEYLIHDKLDWIIKNAQDRDYDAPEAFRRGGTIPITPLLVGQQAVDFKNQVLARMNDLFLACQQEIFVPDREPTKQKLQEVLGRSILRFGTK